MAKKSNPHALPPLSVIARDMAAGMRKGFDKSPDEHFFSPRPHLQAVIEAAKALPPTAELADAILDAEAFNFGASVVEVDPEVVITLSEAVSAAHPVE